MCDSVWYFAVDGSFVLPSDVTCGKEGKKQALRGKRIIVSGKLQTNYRVSNVINNRGREREETMKCQRCRGSDYCSEGFSSSGKFVSTWGLMPKAHDLLMPDVKFHSFQSVDFSTALFKACLAEEFTTSILFTGFEGFSNWSSFIENKKKEKTFFSLSYCVQFSFSINRLNRSVNLTRTGTDVIWTGVNLIVLKYSNLFG